MKKTIAIIGGMAAVLALAVPALAQMPRMPDLNGNLAIVREEVVSNASTGFNTASAITMPSKPTCRGGCSHRKPAPVIAEIKTGHAVAMSEGYITVGRQENGCCDEGCVMPCRSRCRRPSMPTSEIDVNLVLADQSVRSTAQTGFNTARARMGSAKITTGNGEAYSTGRVLVNVQSNDLN